MNKKDDAVLATDTPSSFDELVRRFNDASALVLHGGTRKIADMPAPCSHPEHAPPSHQVFSPGVYEHVCPACKHRQVFRVGGHSL